MVGLAKDIPVLELRVIHPGLRLTLLNYESYLQYQVGELKKTVYLKKCNEKAYERLFLKVNSLYSSTPIINIPKKPTRKASKLLLRDHYPIKFGQKTQLVPKNSRFGKFIDSLTNEILFLETKGRSCE